MYYMYVLFSFVVIYILNKVMKYITHTFLIAPCSSVLGTSPDWVEGVRIYL